MEVSIIIVSYNTRCMTLECLQSVYDQNVNIDFEVIVVDNASSDGSAEAIENEFPDVHLIKYPENLGFGQANNVASQHAKGEYLLLLNPDTVVFDNAIGKLFFFAKKCGQEGIYGGRTLSGEGELDPTSCWRQPSLWSVFCYAAGLTALFKKNIIFDPESYGSWKRDSQREVDIITGCFLMINKSLWDKLHGFSPEFFMYAEEADLCLRAARLGVHSLFCPDATIIHFGGASESVHADKMVKMLKAKIILIRKHWVSEIAQLLAVKLYRVAAFMRAWPAIFIYTNHESCLQWRSIWKRRDEWSGE